MKKFFTFAALAMVAIVACNKEIDNKEENVPGLKPKGEVSIIAEAPAETRTMVDGLNVKWATGDHIGVVDNAGVMHDFTLDSGEGTTTGSFSGSLGGETSGGYAVYPYTANAAIDGDFTVDYPTTYAYNAVTVPMWGVEGTGDDAGKYTFNHIGGAFKISYTNVPSSAEYFYFQSSADDITGTALFDRTDSFIADNNGDAVMVTDLPSSSTMDFIIPVPAEADGTDYSFTVSLLDGNMDPIPGSVKPVTSAKTVKLGHLKPLNAIDIKAAKNQTLWSEDFEAYDNGDQPSESSASVYGGANANYAYTSTNYCLVYASGSLGSKELLIPKSTRSETWVVSNIPTGCWDQLCLTYKANQNISVTSSDVTVGAASYEAITDKYGTYTRTISVAGGLASFRLTFAMTTDSNARIDDILLTAGAPEPGITVTTSAASSVTSSGARLNGAVALKNEAVLGNVSSAGFYYKKTSASEYTKITVTTPLATTSFSKDLADLDQVEYTYYAFAVYNSGDEVNGTTKTFTPSGDPAGADPAADGTCFSLTSYTNLPTGWTCSSVDTGSSYFTVNVGGSMISPAYNLSEYDSAKVTVSIRNYGTGTNNAKATLSVSYDGGSSWGETTTWEASGSNASKTFNLESTLTKNIVIKMENTASSGDKALRVFNFKLQGSKD